MNYIRKIISLHRMIMSNIRKWTIKKSIKQCGANLHVFGKVNIINHANLKIGNNVTLNHSVYINAFNPIFLPFITFASMLFNLVFTLQFISSFIFAICIFSEKSKLVVSPLTLSF